MSNAVSALQGSTYDGVVRVEEIGLQGMITLRADLGEKPIATALKSVCGTKMPGQRGIESKGDISALWMSPDELMLLCPYDAANDVAAKLTTKLAKTHALVVNVSDARASFRLQGAGLREVIAKLAPVDMAPDQFGIGEVRRTRFAQAAAAFWLTDDETAQIFCFRSVAPYMFNLLSTVSRPGTEVGYF
ncbi:MAG: sarcosine oxidase subunit gamma family protein [Paracoccaceae bacterium]|nr:sarcosine oxidase subunit gamma family protein [Paracoccaceae bacterium]